MRPLGLPPWLRRGLEAGIIAALVSIVTLLGSTGGNASPDALPTGLAGTLLLAPAVLSLGVLTPAYPIAYAATRPDAIFGSTTAFLIGAGLVALFVTTTVTIGDGRQVALRALVGILALGPAVVGLLAPQLFTRLGFGRRAGAASAAASGAFAVVILLLTSRLG